jgi:hypothetical protein
MEEEKMEEEKMVEEATFGGEVREEEELEEEEMDSFLGPVLVVDVDRESQCLREEVEEGGLGGEV